MGLMARERVYISLLYATVNIGCPFGLQDVSSCLVAMSMLDKLSVTSQILVKNPDILVTIKKVCSTSVSHTRLVYTHQQC